MEFCPQKIFSIDIIPSTKFFIPSMVYSSTSKQDIKAIQNVVTPCLDHCAKQTLPWMLAANPLKLI